MRARWEHAHVLNSTLSNELLPGLGSDIGTLSLGYRPAVLAKCATEQYERLASNIHADSPLQGHLLAEARRLKDAEAAMGQTLFGPQRDDIEINFRGKESRGYASQGQQRLVIFLLVAALALSIQRERGHRPVMLLDDVVSELDARNRELFRFPENSCLANFYNHYRSAPAFQGSQLAGSFPRTTTRWPDDPPEKLTLRCLPRPIRLHFWR